MISKSLTITHYFPFYQFLVKILKRLIFNSLFEFLHDNNFVNENQSGFRPSDSCEYQLLSVVHDIYASFDCNLPRDVRGVSLDISKAFDRVWHEGLIYKIKSIGVTGLPLELIQSFLSHRFQRVVLNGQSSRWLPVTAGVPQGSILGPLLFLIYINDLSNNLSSTAKLFADDTSLFSVVNDVNLSEFHLNSDLKKYLNGLINGKYLSILIFLSRLKKLYFQEKLLKHLILQSFLMIFQ